MNQPSELTLRQVANVPHHVHLPVSINEQLTLKLDIVKEVRYARIDKVAVKYNGWIISHVVEGKVELRTGGETYEVCPGDVMIHPPNIEFSERNPGSGFHQFMIFHAKMAKNIDLLNYFPLHPVIRLINPQAFQQMMHELCLAWNEPANPWRDFRMMGQLFTLLQWLIESWHANGTPAKPKSLMMAQDQFIQLIDYMHAHYDQKLSRTDFAALMHMHPNYLDVKFRNIFKQTPMEMLREIRLQKAAQFLQATDYTLETISDICGIGDAAYLSKMFKHHYGVSPGNYRKQAIAARNA